MLRQRRNALLQQANVALLLGGRGGAAGSRSRSRGGSVEHPFSSAACFCSSPYANSAEELQAAREAYLREHQRSLAEPESFWAEQAEQVRWFKRWDRVLGSCSPSPRYDYPQWFQGALTNTCYNALDAHVVGEGGSSRASQVALLHDSPVTRSQRRLTYQELLGEVQVMAALLSSKGIQKGDVVLIYMPMIPEAVIAMLACARLGAVHNVVFGGFAADQLAARVDHSQPKIILSANYGLEPSRVVPYKPLVDKALDHSAWKPPSGCLILSRGALREEQLLPGLPQETRQRIAEETRRLSSEKGMGLRPERGEGEWMEERSKVVNRPFTECVPVAATDPLYILYTSGTTGNPKGILRDNGGYMVALKYSMRKLYGARPGETFWAASDIGWVVGHSYIVYAPLLNGNTTVLYEGKPVGTPDSGAFWRVISEHNVRTLFTAPTALRAIKKDDPHGLKLKEYNTSCLRSLWLAGERGDPDTIRWAERILGGKTPVIDHWWQTETGWCVGGNFLGLTEKGIPFPVKHGSCGLAVPGYNIQVLNDAGHPLPRSHHLGEIAIKLPLPPGTLINLFKAADKFHSAYLETFPGYYRSGDAGVIDEEGYIHVMSRTDDVINVAGHRLSTGSLEEVLSAHPDVAECAVIGVPDELKGELPLGFLVLKSGVQRDSKEVIRECIQQIRENIGPVAAFKHATVVSALPKTRSGKILRATMRKIAEGQVYTTPATIEDPDVLDGIETALKAMGYAKDRSNEKRPDRDE